MWTIFIRNTWKYWWNDTDDEISPVISACPSSVNFEIYFLEFQWEIVFGVILGNHFYLKLLENAKKTVIYWKLFWFALKAEIARFQSYRISS